jgi:hypothetical protein
MDFGAAIPIENPPLLQRCANCDSAWRKHGRAARPKSTKKQAPKGTTYTPKNKFKDW